MGAANSGEKHCIQNHAECRGRDGGVPMSEKRICNGDYEAGQDQDELEGTQRG